MADKLATFRLDGELWKAFQDKAKGNDTDASTLLRAYIKAYLDGNLDTGIDRIDRNLDGIDSAIASIHARLNEFDDRLGKWNAA